MTSAALALAGAIAVLVIHNLGVERLPASLYVPACLATAATLVGWARQAGVAASELGLSTAGLGAGAWVGLSVAVLVVLAGLTPASRPWFADRRMAGVGPVGLAYRALVRIPLGTVVVEEVAFRGVLLVLLDRLLPLGGAVVGSCVMFGLWHVVPMRATLRTNRLPVRPALVGAAVVATAIAGAGLCWLRVATDGLGPPAIVHASVAATATMIAFFVLDPSPPTAAAAPPDTELRPRGGRGRRPGRTW